MALEHAAMGLAEILRACERLSADERRELLRLLLADGTGAAGESAGTHAGIPVDEDASLAALLERIEPGNLHAEVDFGAARGKEAW